MDTTPMNGAAGGQLYTPTGQLYTPTGQTAPLTQGNGSDLKYNPTAPLLLAKEKLEDLAMDVYVGPLFGSLDHRQAIQMCLDPALKEAHAQGVDAAMMRDWLNQLKKSNPPLVPQPVLDDLLKQVILAKGNAWSSSHFATHHTLGLEVVQPKKKKMGCF